MLIFQGVSGGNYNPWKMGSDRATPNAGDLCFFPEQCKKTKTKRVPLRHRSLPGMKGNLPGMKGNLPGMKGNHPGTKGNLPGMKGSTFWEHHSDRGMLMVPSKSGGKGSLSMFIPWFTGRKNTSPGGCLDFFPSNSILSSFFSDTLRSTIRTFPQIFQEVDKLARWTWLPSTYTPVIYLHPGNLT